MKIYTVGGHVRDELLNLPIVDRDCVVVGATPHEMIEVGYRPVVAWPATAPARSELSFSTLNGTTLP